MKFNIFGKKVIEIVRENGHWQAFYLGNEGKKRKAEDIVLPASIAESEIEDYLADVFHELATIKHNQVRRL